MSKTKKESYDEAKVIISAGYPSNANKIQNLIYYLSDQNSYGYDEVINYIKSLGNLAIPFIKKVLSAENDGQLYTSLLYAIVREWNIEWIKEISNELNELAFYGNENWDVDLQAIEILIRHKLVYDNELAKLIERKIISHEKRRIKLEELRNQSRS